jgi:hypothetical protein
MNTTMLGTGKLEKFAGYKILIESIFGDNST